MSMTAKVDLMKQTEAAMRAEIPAEYMEKALWILQKALDSYEVERISEARTDSGDLLETYLAAKEIEGLSPKTLYRYRRIVQLMLDAVKVPTGQVTVYHLRQYLRDEKARGISDRTLEGIREVLCSHFGWLANEGLIQRNPCANLGAVKYQKKELKPYTDTEIEKLKASCENLRDLAIITFLMATGCRISEVTQLNREDPDLVAKEVTVLGKGNKQRTVYLDDVAVMYLRSYLVSRKDDCEALFASRGGNRLTAGAIRLMLNNLADKAGVEHVHPHKFRRTLATTLIAHGMPIQEVAAILGHDKLDTTMRYVVLSKDNTKYAYRKYA